MSRNFKEHRAGEGVGAGGGGGGAGGVSLGRVFDLDLVL